MRFKLTFRYIIMVLISTILLLGSAFLVLTFFEDNDQNNTETNPTLFAYNFQNDIRQDENEEIYLSEEGREALIAEEAWLQILNDEGYVMQAYNTPDYVADHYSPIEITYMNQSRSYNPSYLYEFGITPGGTNYLVAIPTGSWLVYTLEIDQQMIRQFNQIMLVLTAIILFVMGYIFSQRIAKPVTQIIGGVENLSVGDYEMTYKEKGLYKSIFASLNQLGQRLKNSETERAKTKEQREKWTSNISHDLKTPLSTIKGYSEILADADYPLNPGEIEKYSNSIYEKSIYMEEMIEELRLNEALMQKGIVLNKEKGNLTLFVKELVIDILNHPDYAERKLHFNAPEEDVLYSFDKNLMKRSIENLIYNAFLHNDEETEVIVSIKEESDGIRIEIVDDGRGMDQETVEKLFQRYYRGSSTKSYKGTGLGMSIAKEVIEAHAGEIRVESAVGKGTTINIRLI